MSVKEFFEMIRWNEYHNVRLIDNDIDKVIIEFSDEAPSRYACETIKGFASDWEHRIYIIWI
jgi:hypothetical protein